MKRLFFILVCLGYLFHTVEAQDIITLTNGKDIRSKVTEINSTEVKYKIFSNLSGPAFALLYSDIFMIKYENGDKDMFEKNPASGKIQIRHIANPKPIIPDTSDTDTAYQFKRGLAFEKGDGVPPSAHEAVKWYTKAAEKGHTQAQYNLGVLFETLHYLSPPKYEEFTMREGQLVNADGLTLRQAAARYWWRKAAEQGHAQAKEKLKSIKPVVQQYPAMSNGIFEMIRSDDESVQFKASKTTSLYKVAFVSADNKIINAVNISNLEGDIHLGNGATAREGSSLMLTNKIELPENTVVQCGFKDIPTNFKPERIMFLTDEKADAMYFDIPSSGWAKIYSPQIPLKPEPNFDASIGEHDIAELIDHKIIEVEITGRNITNVNVRIKKRVAYPVNVRIPVGSYFVSANPAAQNMVSTGAKNVRLTYDTWQNVSVPAACANRPKNIPDNSVKFTVIRSPNQAELIALMPVLNKAGADMETKQAAVWIITDNADYNELGILISSPSNVRAIGASETARAMKICSDAGIDITKKRIWTDKQTIMDKLPAGILKTWLSGK